MTKTKLLLIASLLILTGFVLLVVGLPDSEMLWMLGLGVIGIAMLASLATQWVPGEEEEDEDGVEGEEEAEQPGAEEDESRAEVIRVRHKEGRQRNREAEEEVDAHEHRARAHENRAEAHRELARAHEELAEAEEDRARGAESNGGPNRRSDRSAGDDQDREKTQ